MLSLRDSTKHMLLHPLKKTQMLLKLKAIPHRTIFCSMMEILSWANRAILMKKWKMETVDTGQAKNKFK